MKNHQTLRFSALGAALVFVTTIPAAATAQNIGDEKFNTLIIYGEDECPQSTADQITVCARLEESERFRIPEALRFSNDPANEAWTNRVKAYEAVGNFGPLSCSPVGAGGELGCTAAMVEAAYAERAQGSNVRFGELIAAARAERLSTIDEEAADTQARVEVIEAEYMERLRREREGEIGPADDSTVSEGAKVADPDALSAPPAGL
jgi:hypothetical protein